MINHGTHDKRFLAKVGIKYNNTLNISIYMKIIGLAEPQTRKPLNKK